MRSSVTPRANDRAAKDMVSKALVVRGVVDQHAWYNGGAQPDDGEGAGPRGEIRMRRGGTVKGGRQHQHQQQQHQQQPPQRQQQQQPQQQQQH